MDKVEQAFDSAQKQNSSTTLDTACFEQCRSESIDYAVMEHAQNMSVIPVSMGWSDTGDHAALANALGDTNTAHRQGSLATETSDNCFVRSEGHIVGLFGLSDLAVVASRDSVLVTRL